MRCSCQEAYKHTSFSEDTLCVYIFMYAYVCVYPITRSNPTLKQHRSGPRAMRATVSLCTLGKPYLYTQLWGLSLKNLFSFTLHPLKPERGKTPRGLHYRVSGHIYHAISAKGALSFLSLGEVVGMHVCLMSSLPFSGDGYASWIFQVSQFPCAIYLKTPT